MLNHKYNAQHSKTLNHILILVITILAQWPHRTLASQATVLEAKPVSSGPQGTAKLSATQSSSPYTYPLSDDSTFVSANSDQLGQYVSSGYIDIYIPITRVFTTKLVKDAVARGILPEMAELTLSFYANEPRFCWPMHRVALNGHELPGVLPRANGHWMLTTITFPTTYLEKLPVYRLGSPPMLEWQKVRISVDTAGCHCGLQVQWSAIKLNAPRPIVLVHGWTGNRATWTDFAQLLDDDGMPYLVADLANGTQPIPATGAMLSGQIYQALIDFGVQKVNLVTHSKGGLFARWALDNDVAPMVERLITLAAPHHGISDVSLFFAKANNCPNFGNSDPYEADECQTSADEISLARVRDDLNYRDCKLTLTEADLPIYTGCVLKAYAQPDIAYYSIIGTADGIVDNASSTYPWKADASPYPHSANIDVSLPGRGHFTIKGGRNELNCAMGLIHPRAYPPCGGQMVTGAVQQKANEAIAQVGQQLTWVTHTLLTDVQAFPISIDAAGQATILVNADHAISIGLTTPAGEHFAPVQVNNDFVQSNVAYRGNIDAIANEQDWAAEYRIVTPTAGQWTVRVAVSDAITSPIHLTLGSWVSSTVQLNVQLDKPIYRAGETVRLTALLADPSKSLAYSSVIMSGILRGTGTPSLAISFVDDGTQGDLVAGDGHYSASFVVPTTPATPYLPLEVTAVQGDLRRQVLVQMPISPDSGRIEGNVPITVTTTDNNHDLLYENLTFSPTIYISHTGHFRLSGDLVNTTGAVIAHASTASRITGQPWNVGQRMVPLQFVGAHVRQSGSDGPYRLANLKLYDESSSAALIDTLDVVPSSVTPLLSHDAFEGNDPIITDVTHQVIDTDGNGRFNQLAFTATLRGTNSDDYLWGAWLVDSQGGHIAWSGSQGVLPNDIGRIRFVFDSPTIRLNAQDGPYRLGEIILQPKRLAGSYGRLISLATNYATPRYNYADFDDERPNLTNGIPNLSTRQEAVDFYHREYLAETPSIDWTGNLTDCVVGNTEPAYQAALLQRVNYFRQMAGLPSVVLSATLSSKAQEAALYMARNRLIAHGLDTTLPCYSSVADEASRASNLFYSFGSTPLLRAVDGYIQDAGQEKLGHRRWVLYPPLSEVGTGDATAEGGPSDLRINALYVITEQNLEGARSGPRDGFVAWPPSGYVPYQVIYPYWSFSIDGADFVSATVQMLRDGVPIAVAASPVRMPLADNTLVWVPQIADIDASDSRYRWPQPDLGHESVYTVVIDHVVVNNAIRRFTYTVTVIDPEAAPPIAPRLWLPQLSSH